MVTECELDLGTVLVVLICYYSVLLLHICSTCITLICIYTFYGMHFLMLSYLVVIYDTLHISSH